MSGELTRYSYVLTPSILLFSILRAFFKSSRETPVSLEACLIVSDIISSESPFSAIEKSCLLCR